jgi:hypothetical protein
MAEIGQTVALELTKDKWMMRGLTHSIPTIAQGKLGCIFQGNVSIYLGLAFLPSLRLSPSPAPAPLKISQP